MSEPEKIQFFPHAQNWIKYMISHPCAEPWSVLIETFLPCVLKFAATIYLFDINDMAVERLRQIDAAATGRTARSLRKFSWEKRPGKVLSGKPLSKIGTFSYKASVMAATKAILTVAEPLEKIGFIWLVYSASDQFFYDWTSLLQYRNYCGSPEFTGPLTRIEASGSYLFSIGGSVAHINTLTQNRGGWSNTNVAATVPAANYFVMFKTRAKTLSGTIPDAYLMLEASVSGVTIKQYKGDKVALNSETFTDLLIGAEINQSLFVSSTIGWYTASDSAMVGTCLFEDSMIQIFMTSGQQR